MSKKNGIPKVEEKSKDELEEILLQIKNSSLPNSVKEFIINSINSALWFPHILQKKNISLSRLKKMLFGKGYKQKQPEETTSDNSTLPNAETDKEKSSDTTEESGIKTPPPDFSTQAIEAEVNAKTQESASTEVIPEKKPGHGRMPHTVYEHFTEILLKLTEYNVGDPCPLDCGGKLYEFEPEKPRVLVRIKGQNFADVYKYVVEQLRCNICDYLIQAQIPEEVGTEKYDASFKSWLVLQKYYVAVPFYRQENFQRLLNFPLPDSTQWDLVEQLAGYCYSPFNVLVIKAANGQVVHNDDTRVRIQEVIQEIKNNPETERTGMFTSGFIAETEGHKIALFMNGTNHAGENMDVILEKRKSDLPPIIQMCDALNNNIPKKVNTILCNCLSHGFRKFDELVDYFPTPCITIMKLLSQVYTFDEQTKSMDAKSRLAYHQQHSKPVMDTLKLYLQALFDEKLIEPNSEMGKAIKYMQRHWKKLTRFLQVTGAPLCNNVVERALKIAIRNRKAAMFYRTRYSAQIGGMLTSLIYTCQLANENPHHYLTVLQEYAAEIQKSPEQWLPWNYQASIKALLGQGELANQQEYKLGQASLAVER